MRLPIIFLSLLFSTLCVAQTTFKKAQSRIEEGKWLDAKELLARTQSKEGPSAEISAAWSQWFFGKANPSYQVDSAYRYCVAAIQQLQQTDLKARERLQRVGIDSAYLIFQRAKIDSSAFAEAKGLNNEDAYESFITRFPESKLRSAAIELRDEVSFLDALKKNTYQSFERYVLRYPSSRRSSEAKIKYERLLFESKTEDKKYKSYVAFVRDFPSNSYRNLADRQIFEIATAKGDTAAFANFIREFPDNKWKGVAIDLLFHFYREYETPLPQKYLTDSLKMVLQLNNNSWVPILDQGKFGFLNAAGELAIDPRFEKIDDQYLCGNITDDVLVTSEGLIGRSGRVISSSHSVQLSMGFGFYKIGDSTCVKVVHKSGRGVLHDCFEDVKLLGGQFFAAKANGRWKLFSLAGRSLVGNSAWDGIDLMEGVVVLTRLGKKVLISVPSVVLSADGHIVSEDLVFDDVSRVAADRLLVRNGSLDGLINSKLEFVVPLGRQTLTIAPFGLVRKFNDQYSVADLAKVLEEKWWDKINFSKQWLLLKKDRTQHLFDLNEKRIVETSDSCWFANGLAFAKQKDSIRIHINSVRTLTISKESEIHFVKSRDSVRYFFTQLKQKKTVYELTSGQRLFTKEFDEIESLGDQILFVGFKNKKGLIYKGGQIALPIEYEAIVPLSNYVWSIYKDKKFGLFDAKTKRLIKPTYSRNINLLNDDVLIVFKDSHFGLTNWQGGTVAPFVYDEMQPWTEEQVWVKQNGDWSLLNIKTGKMDVDHVKDFQPIANTPWEKCMLVRRENAYGVYSSKKGFVIPTTFNTIINVGTDEHPMYFADKEVKEAQLHVVIYYNRSGKLVRKQVYEESEFENIVCED